MAREYIVHGTITNPGAVTMVQLVPSSSVGIAILRAELSSSLTTSQQQQVAIVRKSAAATVTAGVVGTSVSKTSTADPTPNATLSTTGTGINATAEGTDSETVYLQYFNLQSNFLYLPIPEERINVGPSAIAGFKFPSSPPAGTYAYAVTYMELD